MEAQSDVTYQKLRETKAKIPNERVLKVNKKILRFRNENVQVLHITENLLEIIEKLKIEYFPSVIALVIEFEVKTEDDENVLQKVNAKIPKSREIFLEILYKGPENSEKTSKVYEKLENMENFCDASNLYYPTTFLETSLIEVEINLNYEDLFSLIKSKKDIPAQILMLFIHTLSVENLKEFLDLKNFKIFLKIFQLFDLNEELLETIIKSEHFTSALMTIIQSKNLKPFEILTENSRKFAEIAGFDRWSQIRCFTLENNFYEFLAAIQKIEIGFYEKLNMMENIENFHKSIKSDNLMEVKSFVEEFSHFKICVNKNQEDSKIFTCALEVCIDSEKYEIYSYLKGQDFLAFDEQRLNNKIKALPVEIKKKIRNENRENAKINPENYILKLALKCDLFSCSGHLSYTQILDMIKNLSKRDEIRQIFEFVVEEENLKLIFDFREPDVGMADPTRSEHVLGVTYDDSLTIFISNKDQYGTFVHELCHMALSMLYENNSMPFCVGDESREKEWEKIVVATRETCFNSEFIEDKSLSNAIIRRAICGSPNCAYAIKFRKKELAVRVVHSLASFPEEIDKLEKRYPEIFEFHRAKVHKDLGIKNAYRMIKLNNNFGMFQKIRDSIYELRKFDDVRILNLGLNNPQKFTDDQKDLIKFSNLNLTKIIIISNIAILTLSRIYQELKIISKNKLNAKIQNIFVNPEKLTQFHIKSEFEALIKCESIQNIISIVNEEEELRIFDQLGRIKKFLIVSNRNPKFDLKTVHFSGNILMHEEFYSWENLSENSQQKILKFPIKFNDEIFALESLLKDKTQISSEVLSILDSNIIKSLNYEKISYFYDRKILLKIPEKEEDGNNFQVIQYTKFVNRTRVDTFFKSFEFSGFLNEVQNDNVLIISDLAGNGKTFTLKKFHEILTINFPNHWLIFISLKKYKKILSEKISDDNFQDFICNKILKLNPLQKLVFNKKYESNEVIIFFDGFDEISPLAKETPLKLFKSHQKNRQSQIFITTRTNLEDELTKVLADVKVYRIKTLNNVEQQDFLVKYWNNEEFGEKCANLLMEKLATIKSSFNRPVIGLLLPLQFVAEYYKNKLSDTFEDLIKTLNFTNIYDKIFERSVNSEERTGTDNVYNILNLHKKNYEALALQYFLGTDHELFGRRGMLDDIDEGLIEEYQKGGIISNDKDKNISFTHETYPEYLVSKSVVSLMQIIRNTWIGQFSDFFVNILTLENFHTTRIFLNFSIKEIFGKFKKIHQELFNFKELKFTEILKSPNNEKLTNICLFILKMFKLKNKELFAEFIGESIFDLLQTLIALDEDQIETFFDIFSNEILQSLKHRKNDSSSTIFHVIIFWMPHAIILKFFTKMSQRVENFDEFLMLENKTRENLLILSKNSKLHVFFKVINLIDEETFIKLAKFDNDDESIFSALNSFSEIFEASINFLSPESFKEFLSRKFKFKSHNCLMEALCNERHDEKRSFDKLWEKVEKVFEIDELEEFLGIENFKDELENLEKNKNLTDKEKLNENIKNPLDYEKFEEISKMIKKSIELEKHLENYPPNFQFDFRPLVTQIFILKKIEKISNLKSVLLLRDENFESLLTQSMNSRFAAFTLLKLYFQNFDSDEFLEILKAQDENGNNFFHNLVAKCENDEMLDECFHIIFDACSEKVIEGFNDSWYGGYNYEKVSKFDELLRVKNNNGETFCHLAFGFKFLYAIKNFYTHYGKPFDLEPTKKKIKEVLLISDNNNFLPIHYAIKNDDEECQDYFEIYQEKLESDELENIFSKKVKWDEGEEKSILEFVSNSDSKNDLQWTFLKFVPDCEKIMKTHKKLIDLIKDKNTTKFILEDFFENLNRQEISKVMKLKEKESGETFLRLSVKFLNCVESFDVIFENVFYIFGHFEGIKFEDWIVKEKDGLHIFHLAVMRENLKEEFFEYIWKKIDKRFTDNEMREILHKTFLNFEKNEDNFFEFLIEKREEKILEFLLEKLKEKIVNFNNIFASKFDDLTKFKRILRKLKFNV
jgi:hypothetical protein